MAAPARRSSESCRAGLHPRREPAVRRADARRRALASRRAEGRDRLGADRAGGDGRPRVARAVDGDGAIWSRERVGARPGPAGAPSLAPKLWVALPGGERPQGRPRQRWPAPVSDHIGACLIPACLGRTRTLARVEWYRLAVFAAACILGLNVLGWGLFVYYPGSSGAGRARLVAYMFGLRHAFDADHIAAIDNTIRCSCNRASGRSASASSSRSATRPSCSRWRSASPSRPGRSNAKSRPPGLGAHRRRRVRHVPVGDRHPQPAGAARHPGRLGERAARPTTSAARERLLKRGLMNRFFSAGSSS